MHVGKRLKNSPVRSFLNIFFFLFFSLSVSLSILPGPKALNTVIYFFFLLHQGLSIVVPYAAWVQRLVYMYCCELLLLLHLVYMYSIPI